MPGTDLHQGVYGGRGCLALVMSASGCWFDLAQWPQFGQAVVDKRVCDGTAVAGDKAPSDKLSDDMSGKALLEGGTVPLLQGRRRRPLQQAVLQMQLRLLPLAVQQQWNKQAPARQRSRG